jgi:hypothetical protein
MSLLGMKAETAMREHATPELARGWLRYEAVRKLTLGQFADLRHRSAVCGSFDAMVDKLVEAQ